MSSNGELVYRKAIHQLARHVVAIACLTATAAVAPTATEVAHAAPPSTPSSAAAGGESGDRVNDPAKVLGPKWRDTQDRAVTLSTDEAGVHLLIADRTEAYQWRTVASLAEPGIDTDQWTGHFCVTGSGQRAVVVYSPRQYANNPATMRAGGFAAVVDLASGSVRKLAERVSLAYYNPGCGAGDTFTLSRLEGSEDKPSTWTGVVDGATGKVVRAVRSQGQLTSAVPVGHRILAAGSSGIVELGSDGRTKVLAGTKGTPYRLTADGASGVAFQVNEGTRIHFDRYVGNQINTIGSAAIGTARLHGGPGGHVFVVGGDAASVTSSSGWTPVDAGPDSDVSSTGKLVVTSALTHQEAATGTSDGEAVDGRPDPVVIDSRIGGTEYSFHVTPGGSAAGLLRSPALGGRTATQGARPGASLAADPSTVTTDPDRSCAVPRNDPKMQVYQPNPKQVEWAADLAVKGQLNFARAANWEGSGLPSWTPQNLFALPAIGAPAGVTGQIPAQVLIGVLAQESNLRQASWHIVDASSGNPLTAAGWYGLDPSSGSLTQVDFTKADCGYGVGQVTSGMRTVDTNAAGGLTDLQQKTVAIDYATNIAASAQILAQKWNETRAAGIIANDGNPNYIENWFFALWDYNSGMHAQSGSAPWGLGWLNNPANPQYPADRKPYLTAPLVTPEHQDQVAYDNAKHPSDWSYPERIMGWAHTSDVLPDYANGGVFKSTYQTAKWPSVGDQSFTPAQPGHNVFCVMSVNNCDAGLPPHQPTGQYATEPPGPCQEDDLTFCWWHGPANWTTCSVSCGTETLAFTASSAHPLATNIYPEQCKVAGLPSNAVIIDDVDTTTPLGPDGCLPTLASGATAGQGGHLTWQFASTTYLGKTVYPSKVDLHQAGAAYGGHFWFAHTQLGPSSLGVTGTWTPTARLNGWTQVMVHIPQEGDWTQQAHYQIHLGDGTTRDRYINANLGKNTWVQLGTYHFTGSQAQNVTLSNSTQDGNGSMDIAWDAAAFVPLSAKPRDFVVAMGDSYASGEGVGNYAPGTDVDYLSYQWNACRRSAQAWPRSVKLHGSGSSLGSLTDSFSGSVDFQFTACSGATAAVMTYQDRKLDNGEDETPSYWISPPSMATLHGKADGQFGEFSQVYSGTLSDDTTLVLLSAGGNDASFPDVVSACGMLSSCTGNEATYKSDIDFAESNVSSLIGLIHAQAKYAKVVLVGYPHLFSADSGTGCSGVFTSGEVEMLNRLSDYLNDEAARTAAHADASYVDTRSAVTPALCGSGTSHLNGITNANTGPGDFTTDTKYADDNQACPLHWLFSGQDLCLSRSSLHPNTAGAADYTSQVTSQLPVVGYP
jgi:hypothetical protein